MANKKKKYEGTMKMIKKYRYGGKMKQGGNIYNAPSHNQGGLKIDMLGNPTTKPNKTVAEVEGNETLDRNGLSKGYVFSDAIINPTTGNTLAADHAELIKKYGDKDDEISRNALKFGTKKLKEINEKALKSMSVQQANQGAPQMATGGYIPDPYSMLNISNTIGQMSNTLDPFGQMKLSAPGGTDWYTGYFTQKGTSPLPTISLPNSVQSKPEPMKTLPTMNLPSSVQSNNKTNIPLSDPKLADVFYDSEVYGGSGAGGGFDAGIEEIGKQLADAIGEDPGSALKIGAGIGSFISSFQPAEVDKPNYPNYAPGDAYYAQAGERDSQAIQNELRGYFNAANRLARDTSGNFQQAQSSVRQNAARLGQEAGKLKLQDDMYNDQIAMTRGAREDQKAIVTAQEDTRVDITNAQNRAMRQDQIQNFMNQMDRFGTEFQRKEYLRDQVANLNEMQKKQFYMDMLQMGMQFPDFTIDMGLAAEVLKNPDAYTTEDMERIIIKRQ